MGFVVVHKSGEDEQTYRHYLLATSRHLLRQGVALDRVPRGLLNGCPDRWLYVSADEDEARALACELCQTTENDAWDVRPIEDEPAIGPLRPLVIEMSKGATSLAFGLYPISERALQLRFPDRGAASDVVIKRDVQKYPPSPEELHSLAKRLLPILTGLEEGRLACYTRFTVIDPVTEQELVPPFPIQP